MAVLECRGCEPLTWAAADGWTVKSSGGTEFEDVDLNDGEWADYDEDHDESVAVFTVDTGVTVGAPSSGKGKKKGKKGK